MICNSVVFLWHNVNDTYWFIGDEEGLPSVLTVDVGCGCRESLAQRHVEYDTAAELLDKYRDQESKHSRRTLYIYRADITRERRNAKS